MAQDIKKLLQENKDIPHHTMPEGHEKRFAAKLDAELPQRSKNTYGWLKIAASIVVVISVGYLSYQAFTADGTGENNIKETIVETDPQQSTEPGTQITLGDISPEFKKIEDYYVANINVALSELDINDENKQLFDNYMNRLSELDNEYRRLTKDLNDLGPNEQTINALIDNLQLRLQLLYKLKQKLNELNELKNENSIEQV